VETRKTHQEKWAGESGWEMRGEEDKGLQPGGWGQEERLTVGRPVGRYW